MKYLLPLLCVLTLGCCSTAPNPDGVNSCDISNPKAMNQNEYMNPLCVGLIGYDKRNSPNPTHVVYTATAVIVSQKTAVVCWHSIWMQGKGNKYLCVFEEGNDLPVALPFVVKKVDKTHDLAIIEFDYDKPLIISKLAEKFEFDRDGFLNVKAFTRMYPYVVDNIWFKQGSYDFKDVSSGVVCHEMGVVNMKGERLEHGDSGSGIFNKRGELVGICSFQLPTMVGIVPINTIKALMEEEEF